MKLWLVRHAAPDVPVGICYGRLDLPALADATRHAASALADVVPAHGALAVSPALRCRQLADALLALRPDLTQRVDPHLVEMDFGAWEGLPWDAIGQPAIDAWTADFFHHAPGGGEPLSRLMARVADALTTARATAQPVVWITHAGVIRAAGLLAQGITTITDAGQWPREAPGFGGWTLLDVP